jgi:hypothetical protein
MSFVLDLQALETPTSIAGRWNDGCDSGCDGGGGGDDCGGSSLSVAFC